MSTTLSEADLRTWFRYVYRSHTPHEDTYGTPCDERGCAVCNLSESEYVEDMTAAALRGEEWMVLPDDDELAEARGWLVEGGWIG